MKIKNIAVRFFAAAMFVSYVGSASAALDGEAFWFFSGGSPSVDESGVTFNGFDATTAVGSPFLNFGDLLGGELGSFSFDADTVVTGIADSAGAVIWTNGFDSLVIDDVIGVVPTNNSIESASVDFAGLATLSLQGATQTVYWELASSGIEASTLVVNSEIDNDSHADFLVSLGGVTAVPVPAAAWLFASAFLGLVGVKRARH